MVQMIDQHELLAAHIKAASPLARAPRTIPPGASVWFGAAMQSTSAAVSGGRGEMAQLETSLAHPEPAQAEFPLLSKLYADMRALPQLAAYFAG